MKTFRTFPLLVTLALAACGGSNSADSVGEAPSANLNEGAGAPIETPPASGNANTLAVSGKVLNVGYVSNATVCLDLNDDGQCGGGEPSTVTDGAGSYQLTVEKGHRGASLLAVITPASWDSASSESSPLTFAQGWSLPTLLEYGVGVTSINQNISPITATYYARIRQAGRNRLSSQIAMFTRIVYTTNLDPVTGQLILPVDFDYVAQPQNSLDARLRSLHAVLNERTSAASTALSMLSTAAVLNSWYSTYTNATASTPAIPVDATKIAGFADTSTSSPAYYLAQDFRYFRPKSEAALRLRAGLTETAGWLRTAGEGSLAQMDRRVMYLKNGSIQQAAERWENNLWQDLTVDEGSYYTLTSSGSVMLNSGTDYLQPRSIYNTDGNRLDFRMPGNNARLAFEVADSPATNFFIEEWLGEQRSYATYYNGTAPATPPLAEKPACVLNYPGTPQPNTDARLNSTAITEWYRVCFDYYTAEYYDLIKGDLALTSADPALPGANFYDATLLDPVVVAPATQSCGTQEHPLPKITALGSEHCNWAVNTAGNHSLADLFAESGVQINSWSKTYGTTTFTISGVATTLTAGTEEQAGLPQQLTLKLVREGDATSGTGTLFSPYGAWTAASNQAVTETVTWEISRENPNMVLISWPFRDINDPRVPTNTASNGTAAAAASVLPGGHFSATWNGNTFSAAPSTHTAPNARKLAILLVDGHFVTGQYYGAGYTYTERYFTTPAMADAMEGMNYVFSKLYQAGFIDN